MKRDDYTKRTYGRIDPPLVPDGEPRLEIVDVPGAGVHAGAAYGEARFDLIHEHLESVIRRAEGRKGLSQGDLFDRARLFEPHVRAEAPDIADEIEGIATGAGIPSEAAWLLQLRAEATRIDQAGLHAECTSFGAAGQATTAGTIAAQNADLPPFYRDVLVLMRRTIPGRPRFLTLTPAGQVGWHGMNSAGVAVFANFLASGGWRPGFPRYLFTRVAFEERSARAAAKRLSGLYRGSSRNVLLADADEVLDIELAVDDWAIDEAVDGIVVHANHHVTSIDHLEEASDRYLANSRVRHDRMAELVTAAAGRLDVHAAAAILRDRAGVPDALCRAPADQSDDDDTITVASTIADIDSRRLWIAIGPPHIGTYHEYEV